jgi:hypothetical protein
MNRAANERGLPLPATLVIQPGVGHSLPEHVEESGLVEQVFRFLLHRPPARAP